MYKFLNQKQKIKAFRLFNSDVYFIDDNVITSLISSGGNLIEKKVVITRRNNYHRIYFFNDAFLLVDSTNKGWLLEDMSYMKSLPFKYYDYDEHLKKGLSSEVFSYNPYSSKQDAFDLKQKKILWSKENTSIIMPLPDIFIEQVAYNNGFHLLDGNSGNLLWTFSLDILKDLYPDLSENWELYQFVEVIEDILWLSAYPKIKIPGKSKGIVLLGVDIKNGEIKHHFHQATPQNESNSTFLPKALNTQYDSETHKLIGFGGYYYWEIDLKEKPYQPKVWDLEYLLTPLKATLAPSNVNAINDTHIFSITAGLGSILSSQVFALNRQTLEVDWQYIFEEENGIIPNPAKVEVTDNHLFVLDNMGTLHIFEKEE